MPVSQGVSGIVTVALAVIGLAACGGNNSQAQTAGASGGGSSGGGSGGGSSGGSSGSGGMQGGVSGMQGEGNTGAFVAAECSAPNATRPADAPELVAGDWVDVSPKGGGLSFEPSSNLTQGMAIDPCNAATLYVCVCALNGNQALPKGLYRSLNGGSDWTRLNAFDSCVRVRVDPENPKRIYVGDGVAGGTHGFWLTTDGGQTWAKPQGWLDAGKDKYIDDVYDIATDPTDFDHVLVSSHAPWEFSMPPRPAGVMESKDGGKTWIAHEAPVAWGYGHSIAFLFEPKLDIGNPNTWLLSVQDNGGRYRTEDAGKTWKKVSDGGIQHGGSNIYYSKDGTLYAGANPGISRSKDNGVTWEQVGPAGGHVPIMGDGETLYTGELFGTNILTAPEANPTTWTPSAQTFTHGPFELAFDSSNRIMYSASQQAGVWALKLP
jgi:photosystem II stability/assembly factor-like uncharacterized protein